MLQPIICLTEMALMKGYNIVFSLGNKKDPLWTILNTSSYLELWLILDMLTE